jgi:hypothetical protein
MRSSPRRLVLTRLAAAAVGLLLIAGCSSGGDDAEDRADRSASGTSAQTPGGSGEADPSGSGEGADPGAGSGATAPPTDFSGDPVVVDSAEPGQLVAVTAESADGVDRLTFQFSGAAPGYRVEQVPRVTTGPEGEVVGVDGSTYLNVAFTSTTPGAGGPISEDVPTNEALELPVLRQIVLVHNVGGSLWFGVGLAAESPSFRVVPLSDPTRLVVEVRAG